MLTQTVKLIMNQQRSANTGKESLQTSTTLQTLRKPILGTNIDMFGSRERLQDTGSVRKHKQEGFFLRGGGGCKIRS